MDNNSTADAPGAVPEHKEKSELYKYESLEQGRVKTRLPIRVKSGSASKDELLLQTADEDFRINWADIEVIALGVMQRDLSGGQSPQSGLRSFLRKVLLSESENDRETRSYSYSYILDIYVKDIDSQFRIDNAMINYKGFIESPGYISLDNFKMLVHKVVYNSSSSLLTPELVNFITGTKRKPKYFDNTYDFEHETQTLRQTPSRLIRRSEIELSGDFKIVRADFD